MSFSFIWLHRKAILTLVCMLCLAGAWFARTLPVAIFPSLIAPRIVISADYGDNPIQTTLISLTRPLEAAVNTVPGVIRVDSTTTRGSAGLDITFQDGTDMILALQRVQAQVADQRQLLPASASVVTALMDPSIFPIMGYSLTSDRYDPAFLRNLALYTLRPRLSRLPGVRMVRVTGGDVPEFLVSVRPEALLAHQLSMQDVIAALGSENTISAVGTFNQSYQRYQVLVSGLLQNADQISHVTLATHNGVSITVGDVATVTLSTEPPTVLATGDGKPSVVVNIIKQIGGNTIDVAREVRDTLHSLRGTIPAGVRTSLFYDQSEIVTQSEDSVVEAITIGGVLALLVLFLFLGNLRAALAVLMGLPLTLLVTFTLLRALGQTLNIMTLGGIAIALGLVIDDGIVVVEDMFAWLERGLPRYEAIRTGLQSITPGMIGSSLTTMAAFVPLTFVGGITGQFFAPLALTMVATLGVSLVLSLLITPLFAAWVIRSETTQSAGWLSFLPHQTERLGHVYGRALRACLRHRGRVLVTLGLLLVGSVVLYQHLQTGFFPEFDEGAFVIDYFTPPGTSLEETDRICRVVEIQIGQTPEVAGWSRLTGARSGSGLELTEPNQGDILVRLKRHRSRSADAIMSDLLARINGVEPSMHVDMIQMLQDGIGDIAGSPSPIDVKLFGNDFADLSQLAPQVADLLGKVPGVVEINTGVVKTGPEQMVAVDSVRASRYGLSTMDVSDAASAALQGTVATTVHQGEMVVGVRVEAARPTRYIEPDALPDVLIAAPGTVPPRTVRLTQVATLTKLPGQAQVTRENQQPMISVTARLEHRDLGSAMKEIQQRMARFPRPSGVRVQYGGLYASQQQSFQQLAIVLVAAVMFISILLLIQFRSFSQVLALMAASICSIAAVFAALYVTGIALNISSFTGAIMIIGVITENGVFLFAAYNSLREEHPEQAVADALVEAGKQRLRPILMTNIGAILAMLPLALGFGAGAAMQQPLAVAVIGGLTLATFFTLLVAPTLFHLLQERR
ncbi:MAG: efflux RND transporter permease subunit [Candidatus Xenobia bacterium]